MKSLTIVIPALNEEKNIEDAVASAVEVAGNYFSDWEVLLFDDGSTDATGEIADRLALSDSRIRVIHHTTPRNVGRCYREAIQLASKEFLILVPGDNENEKSGLAKILERAGTADIIVPWPQNGNVRPLYRRLLSKTFVVLINVITGNRLKYYNGTVLHRTDLLRTCAPGTDGFGYQAEILSGLLARGASFAQVGIDIRYDAGHRTKAFRLKNLVQVAGFLSSLGMRRA